MACDEYHDLRTLERALYDELGANHAGEIPEHLIRQLAAHCDKYSANSFLGYDVYSIVQRFWRKRSKAQWGRFFRLMDTALDQNFVLLEIYERCAWRDPALLHLDLGSVFSVWDAVRELPDGYDKANKFGNFAPFFAPQCLADVYRMALDMPHPFRLRALANVYRVVAPQTQNEIFGILCRAFAAGEAEAGNQLKALYPFMVPSDRTSLTRVYLAQPSDAEFFLTYFVVRNAQYFSADEAHALADRARDFEWAYFKNRSLLKLARFLQPDELDVLWREFLVSYRAGPVCSRMLHNLYHFSAVRSELDDATVVDMALAAIAQFDDSDRDLWAQSKYAELSFLTPHLTEPFMDRAFAIARTVRGKYSKGLISRLKRHAAQQSNLCKLRGAPYCY